MICGCNQRFDTHDEIYRCVDCGVEFHKHCAREHFAKSGNNFLLAKEDAQLETKELKLDLRDLRAEIDRMRPVYELAKAWRMMGFGRGVGERDLSVAVDAALAKETH